MGVYMDMHLSLCALAYAWRDTQRSKEEKWSTQYFNFMVYESMHSNEGLNLTTTEVNWSSGVHNLAVGEVSLILGTVLCLR